MASTSPSEAARLALDLARSRPPTLGGGRLLCIDGPAGSGKSTLAAHVAALAPAHVVHLDDLYDGWQGLATVGGQLASLLDPLAHDEPGHYRRYDWHAQAYAETVTVSPMDLLVLEGVGAGAPAHAWLSTALVWVHAPTQLRLERGLARDGEHLRQQWLRFRIEEEAMFARDHTRQRADVLVDGTGRLAARISPR